jgi:hypothetical protein
MREDFRERIFRSYGTFIYECQDVLGAVLMVLRSVNHFQWSAALEDYRHFSTEVNVSPVFCPSFNVYSSSFYVLDDSHCSLVCESPSATGYMKQITPNFEPHSQHWGYNV